MNPFGDSDVNARVYENVDLVTGQATPVRNSIVNASLASQAVGPVNSDVEMAHGGRNFAAVGKKMLALSPLALQKADGTDSVLGINANPTGNGLTTTYADMITAAFQPKWINGVNPFGSSDTEARVYETNPVTGEALPVQVLITDASLAS